MKKKLLFWCKTSVIDEIVYGRKKHPDDPPYNHQLYEQMCKEPIKDPKGDILGYDHNYPYFVVYEDGTTNTVFEKDLRKQFENYKIPEQEMTEEKKSAIEAFIKNVHEI